MACWRWISSSGPPRRSRSPGPPPSALRRSPASHTAIGRAEEAVVLTSDQLTLARKVGTPITLGAALRAHAAAVRGPAEELLAEAISLLEPTAARYELALALADLGATSSASPHGRTCPASWA